MDFLDDSMEDEILLQADYPLANVPPASTASGLDPVPSPTSSLPIRDLVIKSPRRAKRETSPRPLAQPGARGPPYHIPFWSSLL